MKDVDIARVCHEANRAYCLSLGDDTQPGWEFAPDWQKNSAINGVRYTFKHPDATPADQHENWLKDKIATGWVYGPVKNAELKTHPCCVPYDQLPGNQKAKDRLFRAVALALLVE